MNEKGIALVTGANKGLGFAASTRPRTQKKGCIAIACIPSLTILP